MSKRILIFALVCLVPVAAWALVPSARIVEALFDVTCVGETVCADEPSRLAEASELYEEALQYLSATITPLDKRPLVVFCASESCYRSFGFDRSAAESVGRFCIVVSPRGWQSFFVRHEMIHRLQAQQMGIVKMYLEPQWFIEGMAYTLSGDPRTTLAEPFQQYRTRFQAWYAVAGKDHLWDVESMP